MAFWVCDISARTALRLIRILESGTACALTALRR